MFVLSLHRAVPDIDLRSPTADVRVSAFVVEAHSAAGRLECYYSRVPARAEHEVNHIDLAVDRQGYIVIRSKLLKPA
jgi:hypothetical protein